MSFKSEYKILKVNCFIMQNILYCTYSFVLVLVLFLTFSNCAETENEAEDIRYEAFLEAEPIHPTFDPDALAVTAERPDRLDDSPEVYQIPLSASLTAVHHGMPNINYSVSIPVCNKRRVLQLGDYGTITSPRYPFPYPNMISCEWILEAPPGTRIEATLFDIFTQPWFITFFDYILIPRNGKFTDSERFVGDMNARTPLTVASTRNVLGVRFYSSTYFNFRGFKLQYLVVPAVKSDNFGEPLHLDGICGQSFLLNGGATTTTTTTEATTTVQSGVDSTTGSSSRWKVNSKFIGYSASLAEGIAKVVGGIPAKPFSYPWMTALLIDGKNFCGGSLIDNRHILTAAHCTDGAKRISVLLGSHNLKVPKSAEPSRILVNVTQGAIFQHPFYNRRTVTHDISIIRLPKPVNFTKEIQPFCLPNKYFLSQKWENTTVRTSGWGKNQDRGGSISSQLQHVAVTVMSNAHCRDTFRSLVTGNHLCVGTQLRQSPCKGDSGGPLMLIQRGEHGDFFMQVGLVSFGASSCEKGLPVAFTRITAFLDFISVVTGRNVE